MKQLLLFVFIGIFFVGCTTSSLKLDKKEQLTFNYNAQSYLLSNTVVEDKFLNYKDLFVEQYKLKDESGRVLFYEDARTTLNFEFNYGGLYTVMYIFDNAKEYEEVYRKNNLRLVQLKLDPQIGMPFGYKSEDDKYVNVLIQASDTQIISYVYGFSNHEFLKLARELAKDSDEEIQQLKYQGVSLSESQAPLTNWNDKLVYFTPLITPLRVMSGIR